MTCRDRNVAAVCAIVATVFALALGDALIKGSSSSLSLWQIFTLSSAICYAFAMLLTRSRCRRENVFILSLWLNIAMLITGAAVSLGIALFKDQTSTSVLFSSWGTVDQGALKTLLILSAAIIIGSVGAAFAYQNGHASTIATFDFAYMGFATLWGFLLVTEIPDLYAIAGMRLIVGSGILAIQKQGSDND